MFGVFVAPLCLVFIVVTGMTWDFMVINCFFYGQTAHHLVLEALRKQHIAEKKHLANHLT